MFAAAQIQFHLVPIMWLLLIAIIMIQVLSIFLTILQSHMLVAWIFGVAGIIPVYLRKPPTIARVTYFFVPLFLTMLALYGGVTSAFGLLLSGIPNTMPIRFVLAIGSTLTLSLPRFLNAFYDLRFPLWGEARILDRLSRSQSTGNFIYFTPVGRAYIQDRFGTTPEDFLQLVRRQSSVVPGA